MTVASLSLPPQVVTITMWVRGAPACLIRSRAVPTMLSLMPSTRPALPRTTPPPCKDIHRAQRQRQLGNLLV